MRVTYQQLVCVWELINKHLCFVVSGWWQSPAAVNQHINKALFSSPSRLENESKREKSESTTVSHFKQCFSCVISFYGWFFSTNKSRLRSSEHDWMAKVSGKIFIIFDEIEIGARLLIAASFDTFVFQWFREIFMFSSSEGTLKNDRMCGIHLEHGYSHPVLHSKFARTHQNNNFFPIFLVFHSLFFRVNAAVPIVYTWKIRTFCWSTTTLFNVIVVVDKVFLWLAFIYLIRNSKCDRKNVAIDPPQLFLVVGVVCVSCILRV